MRPPTPPDGPRGGVTFDPDRDGDRLNRQARDVWRVVSDGASHTLRELEAKTGHPQASISARLRDLRKPRYGGHTVIRRYHGDGLWCYQVVLNNELPQGRRGTPMTEPRIVAEAYPCTTCGALSWQICVTKAGYRTGPHTARTNAARAHGAGVRAWMRPPA